MGNPIKIRAIVKSVRAYGVGMYEVVMKPASRLPRFKAGQFLHLTVDEYDPMGGFWPESRVFSIASAPGSDTVSIVYSVKGSYTKKMEAYLKEGASVWLKLPYGDFVIDSSHDQGQDVVLVAGGTGISPFLPYLEARRDGGSGHESVRLFYGVRQVSAILGADLLRACLASMPGFEAHVSVEDEPSSAVDLPGARVHDGRLRIEDIKKESEGLRDPVYYLSGPPAMIRAFKERLLGLGVGAGNIKMDEWE